MRIYVVCTEAQYVYDVFEMQYPYMLLSFYYLAGNRKMTELALSFNGSLMIDSGAYSAFTLGKSIPLDEYLGFCKEFYRKAKSKDIVFINLDKIPGQPGRMASPRETAEAVEVSQANYLELVKAGLPVMPVFHEGEPYDVLARMLEQAPHGALLGISPCYSRYNDIKGPKALKFYNTCFFLAKEHILCRNIKLHNLGIIVPEILIRYPFYSADTSTPFLAAAMGELLIFKNNRFLRLHYRRDFELHNPKTACAIGGLGLGSSRSRRAMYNIRVIGQYQDYLTRLWQMRGICYDDDTKVMPDAKPSAVAT